MATRMLFGMVKTGSGAHLTSNGCRGLFLPGVKRAGRDAHRSSPTSAEVKETWIYTSTPNTRS
jgi:hypothetical protein